MGIPRWECDGGPGTSPRRARGWGLGTGSLGKWLALVAAAWLATGCATVAPPRDAGDARAPSPRASRGEEPEAGPRVRLRHRRALRMSVGTAVSVDDLGPFVVEAGLLEVDAFEKLLVHAGLEATEELPPRVNPFTREEASRALALLLQKPMTLGHFPPRMAAAHLLREVLEGGDVSREELLRRVERFTSIAVLRPDGYLAWVRTGRTQQKVAPVEWRDGAFRAHAFELGRFYSGRGGVFRPVDARMRPVEGAVLAEVYDDADVPGRTLDGAEEAFVELYHALGQFLTRPADHLAALRHLPAGVVALIASSPAYWERFRYMTAGEQMKTVARLSTHLLVMWGTASATTRAVSGALAGAEVPVLSLSGRGVLVVERVAVPASQSGAVVVPVVAGSVWMAQAPGELSPGVLEALGEGPEVEALRETGRWGAGMGGRPRHHVLPREHRKWFEERGFTGEMDIDQFCVELEKAHHQAIHGGGNWRLGRTWPDEWNRMIMRRLRDAEIEAGRMLTRDEILKLITMHMQEYDIPLNFVPWRGR
ncbi:TIGR02269 family lipoprotein [Myxococcus sp. RHSTA-1-4]|uniref:TIGR02269 family lipoprotein n=1 Tax=Myxococcus sp. RHSTA-1-4 TaxID=2874601 RepID=UPI001CBD8FA5|nr:TIGR02269 family lipoprotein [Myxococcus sp. RHSTA-1-4]MBZ4419355.1 TIGR02269 family lipoprotein [Myxococcus sp. RHSTA-1-4]